MLITINKLSKDELIGAVDDYAGAFNGDEEGPDSEAEVGRPGELFGDINMDGGDSEVEETKGELVADAGGELGVPEELGGKEAVEVGWVAGGQVLLGGGTHGYD